MTSKFVRRVSWVDKDGDRTFGEFVRWEGDTAICRKGLGTKCRVNKANLTFEGK